MAEVKTVDMWMVANEYFKVVEPQMKQAYGGEVTELMKQALTHFLTSLTNSGIIFLAVEQAEVKQPVQEMQQEEYVSMKQEASKPESRSVGRPKTKMTSPEEFNKKIRELNQSLHKQPEVKPEEFEEEMQEGLDEVEEAEVLPPPKPPKSFMDKIRQVKREDLEDD